MNFLRADFSAATSPAVVRVAIGLLAELAPMFAHNGLTVRCLAVSDARKDAFQPPELCLPADPVTIH